MLAQLNIRNLAVIDTAELDFSTGFTVLTGETGAGKSILVDALALALGERADTRAVRSGSDRCEITAAFDVKDRTNVLAWLREKRWQSLSFGGITYAALLVPGLNILMMPAAVAGATLFWVREHGEQALGSRKDIV